MDGNTTHKKQNLDPINKIMLRVPEMVFNTKENSGRQSASSVPCTQHFPRSTAEFLNSLVR